MYTRILLPLDSSEIAEAAIPHAQASALAHGAAVHLLQVVDPADHSTPILRRTLEPLGDLQEPDRSPALEAWEDAAHEYLEHVAAQLRAAGVAEVTTAVRRGNAFRTITEEVSAAGCDLVVIATHGRSGFGRAMLGSVADHVIRGGTDAAVLVVRPHDREA